MNITRRRWLCYALGCLPALFLVVRTLTNQLGIDPYDTLIRSTGDYGIWALILTLSVTPLMRIRLLAKWGIAIYRLPLGLLCFTYAIIHFAIFLTFDLQFDLGELTRIIAEKPYIFVGATALLLLIPLALTSWAAMQRRMGKRWKWLHRSIYGIIVLTLLHYFWLSKTTPWDFWLYAFFTVFLLGFRVKGALSKRK